MIRLFIASIFFYVFMASCISDRQESRNESDVVSTDAMIEEKTDSIIFKISGVKNHIDGVDSLTIISANGNELFKIAEGGNLEFLTDTVVKKGPTNVGIITLADYFQDNQIFYVIYNPIDSVLLQSARLYLPYVGLDIKQYRQLNSITFAGDSLLIKSHIKSDINLSLALDTLICNRDGIINYYEFE